MYKGELKRLEEEYNELIKIPPPPAPPQKEKKSPSASKVRGKSPKKNAIKNSPAASPKNNSRAASRKPDSSETRKGPREQSEISSTFDTKLEVTSFSTTALDSSPINKDNEESEEYTGPSDIPPEYGLYFSQTGFEQYAICNPKGFQVIKKIHTVDDRDAYIVRLIAPHGYCALSNIIYVGDDVSKLQLSRYACVSLVFCQTLHMTPFCSVGTEGVTLMKPILPFGTDGLIDSGYYPLDVVDDLTVRPD